MSAGRDTVGFVSRPVWGKVSVIVAVVVWLAGVSIGNTPGTGALAFVSAVAVYLLCYVVRRPRVVVRRGPEVEVWLRWVRRRKLSSVPVKDAEYSLGRPAWVRVRGERIFVSSAWVGRELAARS